MSCNNTCIAQPSLTGACTDQPADTLVNGLKEIVNLN